MTRCNIKNITRSHYALDDTANGITLRADHHIEFDALGFVLIWKSECGYTIHRMRATSDILPACQTRPLTTIRPEFIYARLAYAIFPQLYDPLGSGGSLKRVIHLKAGSGTETPAKIAVIGFYPVYTVHV